MSIFSDLLEEVKESNIDTKLKIICDKIFDEEKESFENPELVPTGPNIFLTIQCKLKPKKINFLCLERIFPEQYSISLFSKLKNTNERLSRVQVWEVKDSRPEKVMKQYAKIFNMIHNK